MTTIALITDEIRGLTADDEPLVPALAALGIEAVPTPWDATIDWGRFAAAVLRTPWDYHERFAAFSAWLDRLPIPTWNPRSVVTWNANKTYLMALQDHGLPVIPTAALGPEGLAPHIARWGRIVVKPAVGGGGSYTFRADAATAAEVENKLPSTRQFLVQPFDPAVAEGEWSLVYFDGVFSHAVFKIAQAGQFLIHEEHGGRVEPAVASPGLRSVGDRFATCRGVLPYARVDLLGSGSNARLVELELIEPELFFRFSSDGPARFAAALAHRIPRLDTGGSAP